MNIPDYMPVLSAGAHPRGPETGACVMEYVSFLAGEKWTDTPTCTNELLARAAQYVNDDMEDSERHRLIPLIGRLMGTDQHGLEIDTAIAEAAAEYVQPLIGHPDIIVSNTARDAQDTRGPLRYVVGAGEIAVAMSKGDTVAFLSALIDAYDKAAGRTAPATVTEDDLRRCAELTGARA